MLKEDLVTWLESQGYTRLPVTRGKTFYYHRVDNPFRRYAFTVTLFRLEERTARGGWRKVRSNYYGLITIREGRIVGLVEHARGPYAKKERSS